MRKFEDSSYRSQVARLRELAKDALRQYDLGPHVTLRLLQHGENATFRVHDPADGRYYCLRLHRPGYQTLAAIRSELMFLEAIHQAAVCVAPAPVRSRDGDLVVHSKADTGVPPRNAVLFVWVEGRFLRPPFDLAAVREVGVTMAHLHRFARDFAVPSGFERPDLDTGLFFGETLDEMLARVGSVFTPPDADLVREAYHRARAATKALGRGAEAYGLIHSDLHRGNFLVRPKGQIAVIDFDDLGWGHFVMDIANAVAPYTTPEHAPAVAAFLDGYRTLETLSPEHEALLPVFYFLRRLFLLSWLALRTDHPELRTGIPKTAARCLELAQNYLSA